MATNITPFFFESAPVRTADIDGAPWFVAADVCSALGFGNARQAVATHVDSDDVQQMDTIDSIDGAPHFVGKDVCEILKYSNPTTAMNSHCKGVALRYPLQTVVGAIRYQYRTSRARTR